MLTSEDTEIQNFFQRGKYNTENGNLILYIEYEKGEKGIGPPLGCAAKCFYKSYKPYSKKIQRKKVIPLYEILPVNNVSFPELGDFNEGPEVTTHSYRTCTHL